MTFDRRSEAGTSPRVRLVFASLALLCAAGPAGAQERAGLLVLEAPASTEAMGLGDAPWLFSDDPALLFYAPALLGRAEGVSAGYQRYGSDGSLLGLSAAGEGLGGGFAVGLQVMRYETQLDGAERRDMQRLAFGDGPVGVSELVGSLGYSRTLFDVRAGAVVKLADVSLNESDDRGLLFDVGLAKDVGPLMIALTARNLGSDLRARPRECPACPPPPNPSLIGRELETPSQVVASLSWEQVEVGPFDLLLASRITRRRDGEVVPAGGFELSYWPVQGYTFRLRGGLQRVVDDDREPFTLGAAFTGDHITIEYAFQSFEEGGAHRFGVRWQ